MDSKKDMPDAPSSEANEQPAMDETEESQEVDETEESQTVDETHESQAVDETHESQAVDETQECQAVKEESEAVEETQEYQAVEETRVVEEIQESQVVEERQETQAMEECQESQAAEASSSPVQDPSDPLPNQDSESAPLEQELVGSPLVQESADSTLVQELADDPPQYVVQCDEVAMDEGTDALATTTLADQHADVVQTEVITTEANTDTVFTVESQVTEMEVDSTSSMVVVESSTPVQESPVQHTGPPPLTPSLGLPLTPVQSSSPPPSSFDSSSSLRAPVANILSQTFGTPVTPLLLEKAGSMSILVPFDQQSLMSSNVSSSPGVRKCGICGKVYRNRNGLYKHRLAKHPQLVNANKPIHCQQPGCTFDCHRLEVLRDHITGVHKIPMQMQNATFPNMTEFIVWKERLEKENCANFVKTRGASGNTLGVNTKHRYYCSRSGFHNSKSTGKRRKVTTKMGAYCTAGINVLEHKSTGMVQAEACITHHGHPIQLEYLKIPPKDKREIACKLVRGKNWDQILAEYHESGLKQGTRSSILTKKDLMNIQRIVKKHLPQAEQEEPISVDQQVEVDTTDPTWVPPPSATCSDSETEIAVESLQRLGEVATTGVATLRDGLLADLDHIASGCKNCTDRDSLLVAGSHIKAALSIFQGTTGVVEINGGSSRTRPVRQPILSKTPVVGAVQVAGGDMRVVNVQTSADGQTHPVDIGENAINLLESIEKDVNSDVRVPATDSQGEGDDDLPVITYRLVPASAENATCPLDSLATTSQYRTLGIRLTKEMLYTLSLICEKHQMDRLLSGGNLINRDEVEIICSKLPDEVIDADMTSIRVLLERDAWYLLESAVETKRQDWKCGLCDKVTGKLHMIRCCSCNNWFHWVCVEIEEQPTEEWFCPGCILRKRMQAIQTKQPTKNVPAQEAQ